MDKNSPFRIQLALIDGFALMSFASITEPFRAANLLADNNRFEVTCCSPSGEFATSSSGALIPTTQFGEDDEFCDLALVMAGGDPFAVEEKALVKWLQQLDRRGVQLGAISGGPVILVKAGLMDNRRMTVHWEHAPVLQEQFPDLLLSPSLYVVDRDRVTCAGGTAPMDYAHLLIAEHCGNPFARLVADWFIQTEVRQSAGPQRAGLMQRYGTRCRVVLEAIEAMNAHIADPLPLAILAERSGVGPRQLNRQFHHELGQTPMAFYRNLRLDVAKNLLENSSLSLTDIGLATGFADSSHFSTSWKKRWDLPPSNWFRRKRRLAAG